MGEVPYRDFLVTRVLDCWVREQDLRRALGTLIVDQETFWRLGFGRVVPHRAVATGQARVVGDIALGHRVLGSMAFMT